MEAWGERYWQAGYDGHAPYGLKLDGEEIAAAREGWLEAVAAVEGVEHATAFVTAANEFLDANREVGRTEAAAERMGRTYEAGVETGEARYRRQLAREALLKAARPRIGGGTAAAEPV